MNRLRTHIQIGTFEIFDPVEIKVISERGVPLILTKVILNEDYSTDRYQKIKKDDAVKIRYGWLDDAAEVIEGVVSSISPGRDLGLVEFTVLGKDIALSKTKIKQSFRDETPESIVTYCINQAGLTPGKIDSPGVILPHCNLSNVPVWEAVETVERTCSKGHGTLMENWKLWFDQDGKVNWGDFSSKLETEILIEAGLNLIRHDVCSSYAGWNTIETFLMPELYASMDFEIDDAVRDVNGTFQALRVEQNISEGRARTFVSYRETDETDGN
ncbi:MAG: hypothetical protein GY760_21245 [Deltaproteobacteria bacterium]|nr:hypothetical protein [Deltaproteobacteria bacterium]